MSSPVFLHKRNAVVKKTIAEKVGNSRIVSNQNYVNKSEYPQERSPVEKPCGKVCGECGKVVVFNRYFGFLPGWIDMHKLLYNRRKGMVTGALCFHGKESFVSRSNVKKLESFVKRV